MGEVTALAHQLAAQARVGGEAVAAVQPEVVVDQQEAAHRHRHRELGRAVFQGLAEVGQPVAFLEVLRLHELVDVADDRPAFGIVVEHRVEHVLVHALARWRGPAQLAAGQRVVVEGGQVFPVVQVQQQRVAALHVLLVDFHHQHVVGVLLDEGAIGVQLQHPVRLAQVAVGGIDVLHHEARVVLAAHGVEVGTAEQVRHGSGQLDHLVGLGHVIEAFGIDQQAACGAVHQGIDQHWLQGVGAQVIENPRDAKAQKGFVLQRLHRPFLDHRQKGLHGGGREAQLEQAR